MKRGKGVTVTWHETAWNSLPLDVFKQSKMLTNSQDYGVVAEEDMDPNDEEANAQLNAVRTHF